jgi:hypothetical protein
MPAQSSRVSEVGSVEEVQRIDRGIASARASLASHLATIGLFVGERSRSFCRTPPLVSFVPKSIVNIWIHRGGPRISKNHALVGRHYDPLARHGQGGGGGSGCPLARRAVTNPDVAHPSTLADDRCCASACCWPGRIRVERAARAEGQGVLLRFVARTRGTHHAFSDAGGC